MTDAALLAFAQIIHDETGLKQNTAIRVGQMFIDIINSKLNIEDYEATILSFNNGTIQDGDGNVGLGGSLAEDREINTANKRLTLKTTSGTTGQKGILYLENTGSMTGDGICLVVYGASEGGRFLSPLIPFYANSESNTNDVSVGLVVGKGTVLTSPGSPSVGIGTSIKFQVTSNVGSQQENATIIAKWKQFTPNKLGELSFTVTENANKPVVFTIDGFGKARFNKYGTGGITGTLAFLSGYDSDGNIIEVDPGDIGGGGGGEGTVTSVNGESPDGGGAVTIDVGVKTINGTPPDGDGNYEIVIPDPDPVDTLYTADGALPGFRYVDLNHWGITFNGDDGMTFAAIANYGIGAVSPNGAQYIDLGNDAFELGGQIVFPGMATRNFANDALAAAGGVPLWGAYHNAGAPRIRIV